MDKPKLHYANGGQEIPDKLWEMGDAIIVYVNEGDFWMLQALGVVDLVEVSGPPKKTTLVSPKTTPP